MAAPLDDMVSAFVESVFDNETLLQTERKQMIHAVLNRLQRGITDPVHRNGMSMSMGKDIQEARRLRKKGRQESEAMGFFGNWAKAISEDE